jgi:hypothetical protein
MTDNSLPPVMTSAQFKGLYSRHGFSQAESGTLDSLNSMLLEKTAVATKQALLMAEHQKKSKLTRAHANVAIDATVEYPRGHY